MKEVRTGVSLPNMLVDRGFEDPLVAKEGAAVAFLPNPVKLAVSADVG